MTRDLSFIETPDSLSKFVPWSAPPARPQNCLNSTWMGHSVIVIKLASQCYANEQDWRLVRPIQLCQGPLKRSHNSKRHKEDVRNNTSWTPLDCQNSPKLFSSESQVRTLRTARKPIFAIIWGTPPRNRSNHLVGTFEGERDCIWRAKAWKFAFPPFFNYSARFYYEGSSERKSVRIDKRVASESWTATTCLQRRVHDLRLPTRSIRNCSVPKRLWFIVALGGATVVNVAQSGWLLCHYLGLRYFP